MPPKKGKTNAQNTSATTKSPTKSQKRRLRRRERESEQLSSGMRTMTFNPPSNTRMVMTPSTDTGLRRLKVTPREGLTDAGIAFLKCAFAPPDFQATSIQGVPDDYMGASLIRRHRFVGPTTLTVGSDYYLLLLPVPGVAYFFATTAPNVAPVLSTVWTAVTYADFIPMFGLNALTTADVVSKFRFVSNHFELIPTINQMTWSGLIQSWKIPVTVGSRQGPTAATTTNDLTCILGLQGAATGGTLANQYTGPFISGLYTADYSSNPQFNFSSIFENVTLLPTAITGGDFGQLSNGGTLGIPGFDNGFQSSVIKISGITASESCVIKTWACVEYQVNPNSALSDFQTLSPQDKLALDLYHKIILNLPVGVPCGENESFWTRVLTIIRNVSGVGSMLPGAYGMAARGTHLLSSAGLQLLT